MLDQNIPTPLYEQLKNAIKEEIAQKVYMPGERMPSEQELEEKYKVSRITVRRAVKELCEDGILVRKQGKGTFVLDSQMAARLDLPVIIHDREAHGDILEIAKEYDIPGVFHCYSGSPEMAKELLKRGWYLGFDGPITYKNNRKQAEVLEICPIDRILIETDSPYLTPVPHRGERNQSGYLQYVAAKIGEIKGLSMQEVAAVTMENGRRLFRI